MFNNRKLYDFIMGEFNSLRISLNEKFTSLNISIREYYDSLIDRLGPIGEDVTAIKDQFGLIMHKIDNNEELINDAIGESKQIPLMMYEDLSKFQKDSSKNYSDVDKKLSQIIDVTEYNKKILDIINIAGTSPDKDRYNKFIDAIQRVAEEIEYLRNVNTELLKDNKELQKTIDSLSDSFALVTQGVYNQDNIEFAAVKTYREGWKYLCYNGRQLTNFDGISNISLNWDNCEKYLNMDISFTGEN